MKYRPRRLRLALLLFLLMTVFCISAYMFFLSDEDHNTRAKFANIRMGMTQEEVDTILGGPPALRTVTSHYLRTETHPSHWYPVNTWIAPNGTSITVTLDDEGRVTQKRLGPKDKSERWPELRRLMRRLGM